VRKLRYKERKGQALADGLSFVHGNIDGTLTSCFGAVTEEPLVWYGGLLACELPRPLSPPSSQATRSLLQPALGGKSPRERPWKGVSAMWSRGERRPTCCHQCCFCLSFIVGCDLELTVITTPYICRVLSLGFQFNSTNICCVPAT
jgi:hypothetical protein